MVTRLARGTIYNRRFIIDLMIFIVLVALVFLLVIERINYNKLLDLNQQGAQRGVENARILKEVLSCTQPEGECSKRGTDASKTAVSSINQVVVDAAYCASKIPPPVSADVVRECVTDELKRTQQQKP